MSEVKPLESSPRNDVWSFFSAGQIVFGRGAVEELGAIANRWKYKKALLVTDPVLIDAGLSEQLKAPLAQSGVAVEVFDGGEPDPSMNAVLACVEQAKQCTPDVLIGLGGGSNMDLAKSAANVYANGGHPRDYVGEDQIPGPIAPLICVPTTSGTGSEVSFASVLKDTKKNTKVGILSNFHRPKAAIVDPLLTVSCPAKVTADSGIDALTHAIEAYTAVDNDEFLARPGEPSMYQGRHPLGSCLAEQAISLIGKFLRRAVANGNDLEAREGMSLGALLAGLSFSNIGVAAVHALEYPIGSTTGTAHGAGNGLLLPHVMRFNLPERKKEFAKIAELLGEDIAGLDENAAAEKAITAVDQLRGDIGVPGRLRDVGVPEDQLHSLAEWAYGIRRIFRVNPREATADELEGILKAAY